MSTLKTLQNGQTGLAFRTDLNENFENINTDLTNLETGYNSIIVRTNTPEGIRNLPLGPTPEDISLVDYELFDSEITEIRTQESNIIKGDYLTQGSGISLTKSKSGVSISIDDNLPYIKSVNGNGTGTTNLENIMVAGDSVLTDVDILTSIHVPEPKSSTEAATKSYVDSHSINFSTFEDNIGNLTYYYMFTSTGISMSIRNSGTKPIEISTISLQGKANTTFHSMLSSFGDNNVKLLAKVGDSKVEYSLENAMLKVSPAFTIKSDDYIDMTFNPIWRHTDPV